MKKPMNPSIAIGIGLATVLALGGCSSSGSEPKTVSAVRAAMDGVSYKCDAPNADKTTTVNVTAMPIVSNGALYAGIDQKFFAKNGLDVKISTVSSVAATIAAVQGGSTDFAFTGTFAAFQAMDKGIPLTIVAPFAGIAPGYWDKMKAGEPGYTREITALLVGPNSGINNPGDLNGKTVAVADVQGQAELVTRSVIKAHGGDPNTVKFVFMSFGDGVNALMAGKVDAAFSAEPQMTPAEAAGYKIISWPTVEAVKEGPTSAMVSSSDYVQKNPETVARFNCAIHEATTFANGHPDVIRAVTEREQKAAPGSLAKAVVPYFYDSVDVDGLKRFYDISKDAGFVQNDLDIQSVVIPQALKK